MAAIAIPLILLTGIAVRAVAVVPGVGVVLTAQTAIIGFDFPDQAGEVVAGAGPVVGAAVQLGARWKIIAGAGYFGVIKSVFHAGIGPAGGDYSALLVVGGLGRRVARDL